MAPLAVALSCGRTVQRTPDICRLRNEESTCGCTGQAGVQRYVQVLRPAEVSQAAMLPLQRDEDTVPQGAESALRALRCRGKRCPAPPLPSGDTRIVLVRLWRRGSHVPGLLCIEGASCDASSGGCAHRIGYAAGVVYKAPGASPSALRHPAVEESTGHGGIF
ncbi:hypothetical protein MSAN_02521500 [Mycena sanguinolenta]|uniref:Uncharacterized protein n=1 Tax=Mycena sanguinolenta TaxID=230812 RepID=A0A8H6WRF6_9AGAR|nr:hypothetical protein MSAN_02521500 [Mycena sanguinolenta]